MNDFEQLPLNQLLQAVAAKTPTPGGGAVAAVTGALAPALAQMVLNYSIGKKSLAAHDHLHRSAIGEIQRGMDRMVELATLDARAYQRLNELWKLDGNDERRAREMPAAVEFAIQVPMELLNLSVAQLRVYSTLPAHTNPLLASDLAIAAVLAEAAARAAVWNVRINVPQVDDATRRQAILKEAAEKLATAAQLCADIEAACTRGDMGAGK